MPQWPFNPSSALLIRATSQLSPCFSPQTAPSRSPDNCCPSITTCRRFPNRRQISRNMADKLRDQRIGAWKLVSYVAKAEFSIVTRTSSKAWIPELIAAAGPEVTESYIDFFTATIRNRNTRAAYARACWQFFDWCAAHGLGLTTRATVPCGCLD